MRLVRGNVSSAELFEVLGTRPLLGRTFQRGEDLPGAEPVAVLSHRLWQELGGDAEANLVDADVRARYMLYEQVPYASNQVVSQVMGRGVGLVVLGSALGILAALLLTRLLSSLLFGVGATDPQALAGAVAALLLVGALAALSPALRASRTDPASVLRDQ